MKARLPIQEEAETARRAEFIARGLGLKVNPYVPDSFPKARELAEGHLLNLVGLGAAASPENIAASAYLLQTVDALCPDRRLKDKPLMSPYEPVEQSAISA